MLKFDGAINLMKLSNLTVVDFRCGDDWLKAAGSLGVTLRAEPRDLAVSVHPVVNVGLALETSDLSGFGAGVVSDDNPFIVGLANRPEGHFYFCHGALCSQ